MSHRKKNIILHNTKSFSSIPYNENKKLLLNINFTNYISFCSVYKINKNLSLTFCEKIPCYYIVTTTNCALNLFIRKRISLTRLSSISRATSDN